MSIDSVVRICLAYALVIAPSCKQRRNQSDVLDVPKLASGEVDYNGWYKKFESELEKNKGTQGILGNETFDIFSESMNGQEITPWSINPRDVSTKKKLLAPPEFLQKGHRLYFQVDGNNPFLFQLRSRKLRSKNVGYFTLTAFRVTKVNTIKKEDSIEFSMNLGLKNEAQMERELKNVMQEISSFNSRYVDVGDRAAARVLKLTDGERSTFEKFQVFFGLVFMGAATFFILWQTNPTGAEALKLAMYFAVIGLVIVIGAVIYNKVSRFLNETYIRRLEEFNEF